MLSNGALTKGLMGTKLTHTNWKSFPLYLDNVIHTTEIIKILSREQNIPFQKLCFKARPYVINSPFLRPWKILLKMCPWVDHGGGSRVSHGYPHVTAGPRHQGDGTQIGPERQRLMVFQTFYIHIHDHLAKHSSNLTALIYFILYIKFGSL